MLTWIVSVLLLPATDCSIGHPQYECGDHGRFEYCVEGFPGCIIGCHCHPGYYFDTQTKICEHNAKLVQDYRRLFSQTSTEIPVDLFNEIDTPPNTTNSIDTHIEKIAKNADDLGDWLYNQFFKTIESQVINNTKTATPPTRRSGTGDVLTKKSFQRRSGKKRNKLGQKLRFKKDKKKDKDFRRKLLRLTEDASLFDSSRSEDSSESDESDSSGASESDEDRKSCSHDDRKRNPSDKGHGHRKIILFNKKPKPQLPSFIYLPNYETPFYPPLGLPAPGVPMYPMVPVPPMPVFPFPGFPGNCTEDGCNGKEDTVTNKPETHTPTESSKKPLNDGDETNGIQTTSSDVDKVDEVTDQPSILRTRNNKFKTPDHIVTKKHRRKKIGAQPGVPFMDKISPEEFGLSRRLAEDAPPIEDVDFKYLADLIHRAGPNDTKNSSVEMSDIEPFRRSFNKMNNYPVRNNENFIPRTYVHDRHLDKHDDFFYSKLGHEIATLIRNVDGKGRSNIESEPSKVSLLQTFIGQNSDNPRSYWERSVRSLLNPLLQYPGEINLPLKSDDLFNLESKVFKVASRDRTYSLTELENIISLMAKAKRQLQKDIYKKKPSEIIRETSRHNRRVNENLNINLLPPHMEIKKPGLLPRQIEINKSVQEDKKFYRDVVTAIRSSYRATTTTPVIALTTTKMISKQNFGISNTQNPQTANSMRHNLRGVIMHNFRNIPRSEVKRFRNGTHISLSDILNLQRFTKNKIKEVTNVNVGKPRLTWPVPNFSVMISNQNRPLLNQTNLENNRITDYVPEKGKILFAKSVKRLPTRSNLSNKAVSYFHDQGHDIAAPSYFSEPYSIFSINI